MFGVLSRISTRSFTSRRICWASWRVWIIPLAVEGFTYIPNRFALGFSEAPRGDDIHWSMTGDNQKLYRWRCRAATYANWPVAHKRVIGAGIAGMAAGANHWADVAEVAGDLRVEATNADGALLEIPALCSSSGCVKCR